MATPRILIYVQHLIGVGHLHRVATIARSIHRQGYEVTIISGGLPDPTLHSIDGIGFIQMPPARARDTTFKILMDEFGVVATDEWRAMRAAFLQEAVNDYNPDVLLTELFPFGRRLMRFELLPLLASLHQRPRRPLIFSSVRDILVDRSKPQYDIDSIDWMNKYYDAAFVHGDPAIVPFTQTFQLATQFADRLHYTGYITEQHNIPETDAGTDEVLVSAGGGAVGMGLFRTALAARPLSAAKDAHWRLLVSRQEAAGSIAELQQLAGPNTTVEPVRPDFPTMLRHCRLSISKAGYNTVMETLHCGARSVVVPLTVGFESEQALRADLLSRRGLLQYLPEPQATPQTLAAAIDRALAAARPDPATIRMNGAEETARLVRQYVEARR